jgi:putative resolvase
MASCILSPVPSPVNAVPVSVCAPAALPQGSNPAASVTSLERGRIGIGGGPRLLRLRDVSSTYQVSPQTIRRATTTGALACLTLPSGHRRFREADVLAWLGISSEGQDGMGTDGGRLVGVVRVSSQGQATPTGSSDKSSLDHQKQRVNDFCLSTYGRGPDEWNVSVGSGLNFDRPAFLALMEGITSGKYKGATLVATDFTRICRFGIKLVEHLCRLYGVSIVYTLANEQEEKTDNESLVDDVLSVLTHFTAKASGRKSALICGIKMGQEDIREAYRLKRQGWSYRRIEARFKKDGRKDSKGRFYRTTVIRRHLLKNGPALEALLDGKAVGVNSFVEWFRSNVQRAPIKARLLRKKMMGAYREWCAANGKEVLTEVNLGATTKRLGLKAYLRNGATVFKGLALA